VRDLLLHMILSHHGSLEYGSPKVPVFLEAMLLHQLDTMDAKMECMRASIEKDRQVEGVWTGYIAPLERTVLKKEKYLESEGAESPSSEASPAAAVRAVPTPAPRPGAELAQHTQQQPGKRPASASPFASKLQEALSQEQ